MIPRRIKIMPTSLLMVLNFASAGLSFSAIIDATKINIPIMIKNMAYKFKDEKRLKILN
jgi:hypothetical protein